MAQVDALILERLQRFNLAPQSASVPRALGLQQAPCPDDSGNIAEYYHPQHPSPASIHPPTPRICIQAPQVEQARPPPALQRTFKPSMTTYRYQAMGRLEK